KVKMQIMRFTKRFPKIDGACCNILAPSIVAQVPPNKRGQPPIGDRWRRLQNLSLVRSGGPRVLCYCSEAQCSDCLRHASCFCRVGLGNFTPRPHRVRGRMETAPLRPVWLGGAGGFELSHGEIKISLIVQCLKTSRSNEDRRRDRRQTRTAM